MAISWVKPLSVPANLTAAANAGGSVPVDTYYVTVVARTFKHYSPDSEDSPPLVSPPATPVSVNITSGNQTLDISWDSVTDAKYYNVYITTKTDGTDNRWVDTNYYTASINDATTDQVSVSVSDSSWSTKYPVDDLSLFIYDQTGFDGVIPPGITECGMGYLNFSGACGSNDIDDLIDALDSAGAEDSYSYDGGKLTLYGSLYIEDGASGDFTEQYKAFHLMYGNIWSDDADFAIDFTDMKIYCDSPSYVGAGWGYHTQNTTLTGCYYSRSGLYRPASVTRNHRSNYSPSAGIIDGGNNVIGTGSNFGVSMWDYTNDFSFSDIIFQSSLSYWKVNTLTVTRGVFLGGLNLGYTSANEYTAFYDCVFGDSEIYVRDYKTDTHKFYNPDFSSMNTGVSDDRRPIITWSNVQSTEYLRIYFQLRILVQDDNANAISGADVVVTDKDSGVVFNTTTDANGLFDEYVYATKVENDTGAGTGTGADYTIFTDYSPHTVTISKTGYKTKTIIYTMGRKINEVQVLENRREV